MSQDYPLAVFYFEVLVDGAPYPFQEVGGLEFQVELEDGQADSNSGGHAMGMPKAKKPGNLTLKRGLMRPNSAFFTWVHNTFHYERNQSQVEPKEIIVSLLDEKTGMPIFSWIAEGAFPIKWSFANLHSQKSEIMVETIEFQIQDLRMESGF